MKLELKHLSPYLDTNFYFTYMGKKLLCKGIYSIKGVWYLKAIGGVYELNECKPILRPLSDLTKEIINTECGNPIYLDMFDNVDRNILELSDLYTYNDINSISVNGYNYLLENHFDVFGLIPKGLAIDINTL